MATGATAYEAASADRHAARSGRGSTPRTPLLVFGVLVALAGPLIAYANRDQWFYGDEFAFLFKRDLTDPASLFDPHWGHLVVGPALIYQLLAELVGLHHYWPYQWLVIAAHLSVAVLLRVLMRKAYVHPWLATAAAGAFLFLGSGRENLAWGFQVTLTGSIAFGLGALVVLLGDDQDGHEHGGVRRNLCAAALVVCAVAWSNVGVAMAAVVGLAAVLDAPEPRSGLRRAAVVIGPATLVYLLWTALAPPSEFGVDPAPPGRAVAFGVDVMVAAAEGLVRSPLAALAVMVVLAVGILHVVRRWETDAVHRLVAPASLLVGAALSALMVGYARAGDVFVVPGTARYMYLEVALLLVPLTAALNEIVRNRGQVALVLACAAVLVGVPGNFALLGPSTAMDRTRMGSAARTTHLADLVAESGLPAEEVITGELTVGGLERARAEGWLPDTAEDLEAQAQATLLLALVPGADPGADCEPVSEGRTITVRAGQSITYEGSVAIEQVVDGATRGRLEVTTAGSGRSALRVRWGPVEIEASSPGGTGLLVCS